MTIRKVNGIIDNLLNILSNNFVQRLQDYLVTIQNNSSNIILTKEITDRLITDFETLQQTDVSENLEKVLHATKSSPFTDEGFYDRLLALKEANYSDYTSQYNNISSILIELEANIKENLDEINKLKKVFQPFVEKDFAELQQENNAIFSIVLNNIDSYRNLKLLNQELKKWELGLSIYQQIISSEVPKPLEIVEVSEGSIEILISLDFDTVSNLIEVFTKGLEAFSAYLGYKAIKSELTKSFQNNKKLIQGEEKQEQLMLENVKEAIIAKLHQQAADSNQKNIEALDKKIDVVTKLLTDQIIKGNNIKLISAPEQHVKIKDLEEDKQTIFVNSQKIFKNLDESTKQKLLDQYIDKEDIQS